ncbi:MAG: hypothetical protein HUK40_12975 [Desulfobacter sp.]|nr:hypothetical protein [Desulfobacter sp.]
MASYRSLDKAVAGIGYLQNKHKALLEQAEFTIQKTDLGAGKGIWHRVIAGNMAFSFQARALAGKMKQKSAYCRPLPVEKGRQFGVHTASYRSVGDAVQGLKSIS